MPKVIIGDVREIILKMKLFFDAEKLQKTPIIPFEKEYKLIAAASVIKQIMELRLEYIDLGGPPKCRTCLSVDRRLRLMGAYSEVFHRLVGPHYHEMGFSKLDTSHVTICWECAAMLRNIVQFQSKVYAANTAMTQTFQQYPMTNLAVTVLKPTSYIQANQTEPIHIKEEGEIAHESSEAFAEDAFDFTDDPFDIIEVKPTVSNHETEMENELQTIKIEVPELEIKEKKKKTSKKEKGVSKRSKKVKGVIKREKVKIKSEEKTKYRRVKLTDSEPKYVKSRFKTLNRMGMVVRVNLANKVEEEDMFHKVEMNASELEEYLEKERESDFFRTRRRQCPKCVLGFGRGQTLTAHLKLHKVPGKHRCGVCQLAFRESSQLEEHRKEHCYKFVCAACGFCCLARNHVVWHYKRLHKHAYKCRKCEISIPDKEQYLTHHKQWHTVYICDYCGKQLDMRHSMAAHIKNVHTRNTCRTCHATFKRAESLKKHTLLSHSRDGAGAYCVECDRHFEHQFAYKEHLRRLARHQPPREKLSFPCPDCDKSFSKKVYMKNHHELIHLQIYKYRCEQCDKNFLRRSALNRHTWKKHELRPLPRNKICQFCGRGFTNKTILDNHIRTHTGERPFQCPHCSASFAQLTAMKTHVKNVHKYK